MADPIFGRRKQAASNLTVLGEGSALEGKITTRGPLRVDGAVSGQLVSNGHIDVGTEGRVLGRVRAAQLAVAGRIDGIVHASEHLDVRARGQVHGHARYATLSVERGGVMNASTSLTADFPESDDDDDDERDAAE